MADARSDKGYQRMLVGIRGILKILIWVFLIIVLIFFSKKAYSIGYDVFHDIPVEAGEGTRVVVTVTEEMSVSDVGDMLREQGLIHESGLTFRIQEYLSAYRGKILPGTYILNTNQTVEQMLKILAREDTAGQPSELIPETENLPGSNAAPQNYGG